MGFFYESLVVGFREIWTIIANDDWAEKNCDQNIYNSISQGIHISQQGGITHSLKMGNNNLREYMMKRLYKGSDKYADMIIEKYISLYNFMVKFYKMIKKIQ